MSEESKDPRVDDAPAPTNNPEGAIPENPERSDNTTRPGVSGDEAEAAGRRATADEPVSRDEVIDQAAYKDASADAGQQASAAERDRDREE